MTWQEGEQEFYAVLGPLLRRARNARGMSQEYVAQAVGLSRPSISNIESGKQGLTVYMLTELLDALGLELWVREG